MGGSNSMTTIDPDSDEARLAAHRKLHNIGLPPHPDSRDTFRMADLETSHDLRARLVDLGWTPPNPHTIEAIPTVAWQHPVRADLVTTDPNAYTGLSAGKPPELVRKDAVYDRIDWLEHGVDEWRAYAVEAGKKLKLARDHKTLLLRALKATAAVCAGETMSKQGLVDALELARTVLRITDATT